MQSLPATFRSDGFDFTQIKRQGDVVLFEKTHPKHTVKHYEVVIAQKRKAVTWPNGITTVAHESMPSSEQWGIYGWSPFDLPAALIRFQKALALSASRANGEL